MSSLVGPMRQRMWYPVCARQVLAFFLQHPVADTSLTHSLPKILLDKNQERKFNVCLIVFTGVQTQGDTR